VETIESPQVETHQEQLQRLESEVESLRQQLQCAHRLATVGTMTAMVAHEFNNILTPIINYAQMARKDPGLIEKALLRAADGGTRASNICRALLGLAKGHGNTTQEVDLCEIVAQVLEAMARRPEKDSIDLRIDIPEGLRCVTRPTELQQVLLNLLINARTAVLANHGERRIGISASRSDEWMTIRVSDNGKGIEPGDLERIFHPFYSADGPPKDQRNGYGLGLAFCRKIVTDLGGEISVESTPGEGSTFILSLPV